MTPTVKAELATLRQHAADLEWKAAAIDETAREKLLAEIDRTNHRIAYLSEYERLGYEYEPDF